MLNKSNTTSNSKRKNMTIFRSYFVIFDGLMINSAITYIYICVCVTPVVIQLAMYFTCLAIYVSR